FLKFDLAWHTSGPIWNKKFLVSLGGFNIDFQRLQDPELHTRVLLREDINFKYLMHETIYDVLHRNDDERVVWDNELFVAKRIEAIIQFIQSFYVILEKAAPFYLKYLQGYFVEAEKIIYRYLREEGSRI